MKSKITQCLKRLGLPIDFPADFLPRSAEAFRRMIAKSADTPDDYAVAHILVAAATAMGKNVRSQPQSTGREPVHGPDWLQGRRKKLFGQCDVRPAVATRGLARRERD
jgi:hypothetical protein